jgi:hypothetical protein
MGWGGFGSNDSVHWEVGYEVKPGDPPDHKDYDDIDYANIGRGKRPGKFLLTLRYPDKDTAMEALRNAQSDFADALAAGATDYVVKLEVKCRPKQKPEGPISTWEIKVDW